MGVVEVLDSVAPARAGGWKVDVSRGERNGRVSSEWFNRPDDERYLSLDDLWASVKGRSERSRSRVVQTADIRVEAARDNPERLHLMLPKAHEPVAPTHWAFGQLASIVGAPASYLRQLPAPLAGINLQYGLTNHRAEQVKTFETEDGRTELRAVTGLDYGRIHDHELVEAVQRIAGNGTGDTRWKVDVSRGERNGRVSSEWFNRPDDERYLSLDDLWASVKGRSERSRSRVVQTADIRVEAARDSAERLHLMLPKAQEPVSPTHWAFGQLASIVGAPASYLRQLPAPLAGINLQYGLTNHRAEQVKTFETEEGRTELRAVTGPDYGRIHDHELVEAVQRIAGNGTGDTRWKVPGVLDWSTGVYNPDVEISRDTTTLYASDRDVFLFLVDDHNPIEAGRLPDGSPDLYFRGFYCWNSEVGAKTLGMASFYLRAVCQNRNLWGVEEFQEITIRHSKYAASRFAHEAAPALTRFANSSPQGFMNGIKAARQQIVARTDEDRDAFLRKRGFSKAESGKIIEKVLMEEGRPPESIFDFVQGITRLARDKTQQDARLDMEGRAKKLLDRVG